ncbi:hypothetical protein DUI87_15285 [Hirundo rustica rustica]|uniref:Uncharacterized protein n=1 Tax=Hirundo rustica rustica TaxID=333673 RepID=A0A3M0K3R0_HIRRU|nr:hypothetical protein DUI87_15285 [Hirundo rustica rustica]
MGKTRPKNRAEGGSFGGHRAYSPYQTTTIRDGLKMRCSSAFPGTEVRLTGWRFPGFSSLPILKAGVTFASCQSSGTSPDHHSLIKAPGFVDAKFARVISNPALLDQAEIFSPPILYSVLLDQRSLRADLAREDWCKEGAQ